MTTQIPKRRWYQYSLRTLFVVMVLCAIACSWLAVKMQRVRKREEAVKVIVEAGGSVGYEYEEQVFVVDVNGVVLPHPSAPHPPGPAWMRKLLGEDFFATVIYANVRNDEEMEHLKELKNLELLALSGTQFTDVDLEHMNELTKLETLILSNTRVTDEGLRHLKELTNLLGLVLRDTQVSDSGLVHLERLGNLKSLNVERTQVTEEGIEKLQEALPECEIAW